MKNFEILNQAITKWGRVAQTNMALEEMGELITSINQYRRGRVDIDAVREEIADVLITAKQLAIMYGPSGVERKYNEKIRRLQERLRNSE